ncbi:hypothetical protein, partial [Salmonella sp. SAL4356]|uniref:hypothetical protein n=1 Tax=Salmonella sp. SAL4356 TaxID=3159877 RepID=UPI00397C9F82
RAELRRTTIALRGKLANTSGEEKLLVLLALALLTMPHGDDAPEGLPAEMAQKLSGLSLGDVAGARAKVGAALGLLPATWA